MPSGGGGGDTTRQRSLNVLYPDTEEKKERKRKKVSLFKCEEAGGALASLETRFNGYVQLKIGSKPKGVLRNLSPPQGTGKPEGKDGQPPWSSRAKFHH